MDTRTLICDDCGGTGVDPGSLYEPEQCPVCLGGGKTYVELDTRSSNYGQRKPMAREIALPAAPISGEIPGWLAGGDR